MHRVLMLVNNDWKVDSRVMREAATLAEAGHEVHVISRHGTQSRVDRQGAVTIHNIPLESAGVLRRTLGLLRSHRRVVRAASGTKLPEALSRELHALTQDESAAKLSLLRPGIPGKLVRLPPRALLLVRRLYRGIRRRVIGPIPDQPAPAVLERLATWRGPFEERASRALWPEFLRYLNGFAVDGVPLGVRLAPTVVHAHDLVTLASGYAIATRLDCPLVYDAHELETHTNYWSLEPRTHRWVALYEAILVRHTAAVVTVCDSIADWLRDHYAIPRPVVALNSPDLREPQPGTQGRDVRTQLGLAAGTPLAVYVGSVTLDRGMVQCVQATARVPGLHFAFVGPRYQVTEAEIVAEAQRLGIRDRVHLVDPVPSREVSSFVSTADCSVIAIQNVCLSYYFCFPNKLLESVISGVPVAVARLVELERFIGRFPVGLTMDETQPQDMAAAIQRILAEPGRFRATPEMLAQIRREYGWPAQQERLTALYARLGHAAAASAAGVPEARSTAA